MERGSGRRFPRAIIIFQPAFLALLETFSADRIMFSTACPFVAGNPGGAFLERLPVPADDLGKTAHGDADRLLKLTPA